jgi:hypothetical protein
MNKHLILATVAAAAMGGAGLLWPAGAQADSYYGPLTRANGQCWHSTFGVGSPALGYWGDCQRDAPSLFRSERNIHSDKEKGRAPYPGH